jgi:ankyrin repeat protein
MSRKPEEKLLIDAIHSRGPYRVESVIMDYKMDVDADLLADNTRCNALSLAAGCGYKAIVDSLLDIGANINRVSGVSLSTACHFAALKNRCDVVDLLIGRGANVAIRNANGATALCHAVGNRHERLAIALINAGTPLNQPDTLCRAATISVAVIKLLCDRLVDVGTLRDGSGNTPLHFAARRPFANESAVIDTLLNDSGVDVNARGTGGASCAHVAAGYDRAEVLYTLIANGADVNQADDDGCTPLHAACDQEQYDGSLPCAVLLLTAGADAHAANSRGQTACHLAALSMDGVGLLELLAAGADFDAPDSAGNTPRQIAADNGHTAPTAEAIEEARRRIAGGRIDHVRKRAFQVCVGLQPLGLDVLQLCEVLPLACGPLAAHVSFAVWWKIATTVKHFKTSLE